jgi:hypothetical protein
MNKKLTFSFLAFLLLFAAGFVYYTTPGKYEPRKQEPATIDGAFEYLSMLRSNQETGTVTDAMVAEVMQEIKAANQLKTKTEWPIRWTFTGPDNIGGRTRCFVVDKDNNQVMYTGGVSGKVFKSTNGGASWYSLNPDADHFGIVSMAQTQDGAIYYGTGEGGFVTTRGDEEGTPGFNGSGIYKSTDGETFTLVSNTTNIGYISTLTAHPSENWLFAGTQAGLRYTADGGQTWNLLRSGSCRDIKFNKNGTAIAYVGSSFFRSTNPTDPTSWELIQGIGGNRRGSVAWSESDPNYCYIVTVGTISTDLVPAPSNGEGLNGFYRSTDEGVTFVEEVNEASRFFAPFSNLGTNTQGDYDQSIAVHPTNKDRVFIGGVGFAEWTLEEGPKMVGNTFASPTNRFGIHPDKHFIHIETSHDPPIMYIGCDGGIFRTTNEELTNYTAMNLGYNTTQFYGIAASREGRVLGGTQDNNTILVTKESFPRKNGITVLGGDGFRTEISQYDPLIMFGESQFGNMRRSIIGGQDMNPIWDNRIRNAFASASQPTSYFNTPLELWEDPAILDSVKINGSDVRYDTLIKSRLYMGFNDGVYVCNNAVGAEFNPDRPSNDDIRWFKVSSTRSVHQLQSSKDGDDLYIGTTNGRIFRVSGLNSADFDTTVLVAYNAIPSNLEITDITNNLSLGNRTITGIAIDESNPERLIISAGSYGNTNYVYETTNAKDAQPDWTSIQGNLPRFPVYHVIISADDPNTVILGTEFGIWASDNVDGGTPTWSESIEGVDPDMDFPRVPVFELVQVKDKPWSGPKVYAGTHGMGIWETASLLTDVRKAEVKDQPAQMKIYPNPANVQTTLQTNVRGNYSLNVYGLNGQVVYSNEGQTSGQIELSTTSLPTGTYFVEVLGKNSKDVAKLIVQH